MTARTAPDRKFEINVALLLGVAVVALWVCGESSVEGILSNQLSPVRPPAGSGSIAILGMIALVLINGTFLAAETALETIRPMHIKFIRETSPLKADQLQDLLDGKQKFETACLLASRLARIGLVFFVLILANGLALVLEKRFNWELDYRSIAASIAIVGIPSILVNLIAGELVPKSYAAMRPHVVLLKLNRLIRTATFLLSLPAGLIIQIASLITSRFGGKVGFTAVNQAEEEIKDLVESAEISGEIESDERELIHSVFEFNDRVAREIMTPRVDLDAMPVSTPAEQVVKVIEETGHSRIPLFDGTDDQIVGIIHAKDLLMAMIGSQKPPSLRSLMRAPLFVPEGKSLHELLQEMRTSRSQMAVVQDEFGGTAGIVTIEDIVEELVGEIRDEYDREEEPIQRQIDGWMIAGRTHLDDVNDEIGSDFDSEEFDSIGGYVFGLFGRQPAKGESITADGYDFVVAETDGRRILKLHLKPSAKIAAESSDLIA